jgi:beta-lactamase regulating signal transducer with metallopeptidase domain
MNRLLAASSRIVSCRKMPELRMTTELSTAAVIGWLRPIVLLPADADGWSDDEVLGVLCHELTHVKRNDWFAMLIGRVVAAVYWPNPLIHLALRLSSRSREMLADEAVLDDRLRVDVYAGRLIAAARASSAAPQLSVALGFASGDVDVRVRALFAARRDRRPVSRRLGLVGSLSAMPLLLVLAAAEPWTCVPSSSSSTAAISCD